MLNRAAKFGDGLFETLRISKHKILFWEQHKTRLLNGLECLQLQPPNHFSLEDFAEKLAEELLQIATAEPCEELRVRVDFWRTGQGAYLPLQNTLAYEIGCVPLQNPSFCAEVLGINVGICPIRVAHTCIDELSNCKTLNGLRYVRAAQYAQAQGWQDAILLNPFGRVAEASASNIFLYFADGRIQTPPLSEGLVSGTIRAVLCEYLPKWGFVVEEKPCTLEDLAQAQEIWLTNAIQGIRFVQNLFVLDIFEKKNRTVTIIQQLLRGLV